MMNETESCGFYWSSCSYTDVMLPFNFPVKRKRRTYKSKLFPAGFTEINALWEPQYNKFQILASGVHAMWWKYIQRDIEEKKGKSYNSIEKKVQNITVRNLILACVMKLICCKGVTNANEKLSIFSRESRIFHYFRCDAKLSPSCLSRISKCTTLLHKRNSTASVGRSN